MGFKGPLLQPFRREISVCPLNIYAFARSWPCRQMQVTPHPYMYSLQPMSVHTPLSDAHPWLVYMCTHSPGDMCTHRARCIVVFHNKTWKPVSCLSFGVPGDTRWRGAEKSVNMGWGLCCSPLKWSMRRGGCWTLCMERAQLHAWIEGFCDERIKIVLKGDKIPYWR